MIVIRHFLADNVIFTAATLSKIARQGRLLVLVLIMDRSTRRPTRRTVPRKYTEDPLEIEGLGNSDPERETQSAQKSAQPDESDEEFVIEEDGDTLARGVEDDEGTFSFSSWGRLAIDTNIRGYEVYVGEVDRLI